MSCISSEGLQIDQEKELKMDNGASIYLRFLKDDNEAFVELVREYNDKLVLFLNTIVNDIHISEEAADETFLKLYTDRPAFKSGYSFKTWLYTIGKNTALNYLKKLRKHKIVPLDDLCFVSDGTDIEAECIQGEEKILLNNAIKSLKSEYSQVLYLIYFEDMSTSEAAKVMQKNNRQISNLIYRAKIALKEEMEKREQNG